MKWYEAVLIGGAIVGIYSVLSAIRDDEEGGGEGDEQE